MFYNKMGFMTLLQREIHRFMKVWVQTVLAPLLSNVLYLGVFSGVMKTREIGIGSINYLEFLVPGLAVMGALMAAFQNPSFSIISQKFQNTIQDLNSFPISDIEKTLAFILGGTFRGLLVGVLTYFATIPFVGYRVDQPVLFFMMLAVVSFIFASMGLIAGLAFNSFERLNFVLTIVIMPLTYFGGVFFELSKLPGVLAWIKYINPAFPLTNLTRYAYLNFYEGELMLQNLVLALFLAGSFLAAMIAFKKGIGIKNI